SGTTFEGPSREWASKIPIVGLRLAVPSSKVPTETQTDSIPQARIIVDAESHSVTLDGAKFKIKHAPTFQVFRMIVEARGNCVATKMLHSIPVCGPPHEWWTLS